jgi:hypothetical protein
MLQITVVEIKKHILFAVHFSVSLTIFQLIKEKWANTPELLNYDNSF